jgi:TRAP-type C4-dicarboxylate transport system substrate-binding protein
LATVWDMPFIHTSPWVQQAVIRELLKTYSPAQEEWHKNGVHAIFNGPCSGGGIYTSKKQVKSLEDLKGLKLRTYGYVAKAVNRLGGVSVSLPVPEMYTAIQRGTVDGAMFWLAECEAFKLNEITKYFTMNTGLDGCCSGYAFMNLRVWNNLPSSVKEVIEQLDNEWVDAGTRLWVITELKNIEFMNKKGMKIYILPDEERARWTEKVNPDDLHAEWVKINESKYGAPAGEYLKKVKQLIDKYREQDIFREMYKVCLGGSE